MTLESKALRPKRSASATASSVTSSQVGAEPPNTGRRRAGAGRLLGGIRLARRAAARPATTAIHARRSAR